MANTIKDCIQVLHVVNSTSSAWHKYWMNMGTRGGWIMYIILYTVCYSIYIYTYTLYTACRIYIDSYVQEAGYIDSDSAGWYVHVKIKAF